jgi:hypothetical protein
VHCATNDYHIGNVDVGVLGPEVDLEIGSVSR